MFSSLGLCGVAWYMYTKPPPRHMSSEQRMRGMHSSHADRPEPYRQLAELSAYSGPEAGHVLQGIVPAQPGALCEVGNLRAACTRIGRGDSDGRRECPWALARAYEDIIEGAQPMRLPK